MGDDRDNDAKPKHRLWLPTFQIGKYPVTNKQHLRFLGGNIQSDKSL